MESMPMKRLLCIAALAASTSACVDPISPVQLLEASPLQPNTCQPENVALIRGHLDFAVRDRYVTSFGIFSPLVSEEGGRNDFFGQEIVLNYQSKNPEIDFIEERLPIYFVVRAGASDGFIYTNIIGSEARRRMVGQVPAFPDSMTLLVTLQIKGKYTSGREAETNKVTYPIEITRSAGCQTGAPVIDPENPCLFPGQDGTPFTCG
jgi:hypothetical protein